MTELSQFLNALRADPFDPLPRLVFADWLDENADPDRAELIRLQVRASTWNPDPGIRAPLSARIDELADRVLERTFRQFPDRTRMRPIFRAGLIDICCSEPPPAIDVPEVGIVRLLPRPDADFDPSQLPAQWVAEARCILRLDRVLEGSLPADPTVVTNSLGMRLAPLPPGTFRMGSSETERGHDIDEFAHSVTLTNRNLYVGVWPVTQRQYADITGRNPSITTAVGPNPESNPVQSVSHEEAIEFCRILSSRSDELAAGRVYRLPTEAEWEYASRAGTGARFHFGEEMTPLSANCMHYYQSTLPCGCFPPNDFGLYDMHGQVREWCADWYHRSYYEIGPSTDPRGPDSGDSRVMRGGAWDVSSENYCRCGYRVYYGPTGRLSGIGFRTVCTIR